jgi:probable F420-dependent oxidoreductase
MEIGVTFPQTEIGSDPETIVEYARLAESRGYGHLLAYDHVLGANADREGGWDGPYDHSDQFHEPLSLFSYLAGRTDDIEFVTGILILPQRQTAIVAKQTAQVDRFSGGRLRLGVGVGWNPLEYVALGESFERRGARIEEQLEVLRALWTENPTTFEGEFHELPDVGINPLPVQQPVPLWMGGDADPVLRRVARTADGWLPRIGPDGGTRERLAQIHEYAREVGRDPDEIGVHGRIALDTDDTDELLDRVEAWERLGADYLAVDPMRRGRDPEDHLAALDAFADAMASVGISLEGSG